MSSLIQSLRNDQRCRDCGFCQTVIGCPAIDECIGCLACYRGCPFQARNLSVDEAHRRTISCTVNNLRVQVPAKVTVQRALESVGIAFSKYPKDEGIFAPCEVGGCYSCAVVIDGEVRRSCVTPIGEGMDIQTRLAEDSTPLRIVHGPKAHSVGGKATPWRLKRGGRVIEVAVWTAGCCYACPQCQNYAVTYDGQSLPSSPQEAAKRVTLSRRRYGVDRMAISGGEATLNRRWLVDYFQALKRLNPDEEARFHLDSNGAILTPDYLDELILDAGVTDIGIEPKGIRVETFTEITALEDPALAARYLTTSWDAVKYVVDAFSDRVFVGVGLPYNEAFISLDEVQEFGSRLAAIDPHVQLCVLDYFPTFRRVHIERPTVSEMRNVKNLLEERGLKTVIVQTSMGHIGPKIRQ